MIKFRAHLKDRPYLKGTGIIVDVQEINYKYEEIVYENEKYMEVADFKDVILLQSTGLKDKHGVEIYEGDVVKTKYGEHGRHIGVVKYGGANFYSEGVKQYLSWHEDLNGLFEIIGNRYEHPHLLEGDNKWNNSQFG